MRQDLQQIKMHVYNDGQIDDNEVEMLRGLLERSELGEEEVVLMLDLNTVLSGNALNENFVSLLVDAVSTFVLAEGAELNDDGVAWLKKHVMKDKQLDANERLVLERIAAMASSTPASFAELLNN